jgi:hypothetical protein
VSTAPQRPVVYFHVGVPKTGTTYLQHVLAANRDLLRERGLLYPGVGASSQWTYSHYRASLDLRGASLGARADRDVSGSWRRLVDQVAAWPGPSLIDHESFAAARDREIRRARADLAFAELHLVVTARDLARQIPAVWQERIKNRSTASYREFLAAIQAPPRRRSRGARRFWRTYGLAQVVRRWSADLDPSHVHIVTVPPSTDDPTLLWRRFAGMLGLEPGEYDAAADPAAANRSLGAAEAAVIRRFNELADDLGMPWPVYHAFVKHRLAVELSERRSSRIEVPEPVFDFAVEWSHRTVAELTEAKYDIVGDLGDLIPRTRPTGADPDSCPAGELYEAAMAGMSGLAGILLDGPSTEAVLRGSRRGAAASKLAELVNRGVDRNRTLAAVRDTYRRRSRF